MSMTPQGGGDAFTEHGTLLDRVYSKDGDDFLGVRLISRTNGTMIRTGLRFFRLLPSGELVDDGPLESFCWENAGDDFPHHDPIGVRAELVPGPTRERRVELRDPLFRDVFPDSVTVQETVTTTIPRALRERFEDPSELQEFAEWFQESMHATLERTWKSDDDKGMASADGEVNLLSLRDTSVFEPASCLLLERDLEFSYLRKGYPMIQTSHRTLREVSWRVDPFLFDRLEDDSSALALREAYHVASTYPRDACNRLTEWARDERRGYLPLEDVAAQIWLIASRAEREHSSALSLVRTLGAQAPSPSDEDTFEALRRGRLSALFTHLGLDSARHRAAYAASLGRRGVDAQTISFLMRVHDHAGPLSDDVIPEPQRSQGSELLEAELRDLARGR